MRNEILPKNEQIEKFEKLLKSDTILFRAKAVFPFHLAPDELIIDTVKVSLRSKRFMAGESVETVLHSDIQEVTISLAFLFANLTIRPKGVGITPLHITYLWKHDAIRAKQIIEGIQVALKQGIEPGQLGSVSDLAEKIIRLGSIEK